MLLIDWSAAEKEVYSRIGVFLKLSTQQMFSWFDYFSATPLRNEVYTAEIAIWCKADKLTDSDFETGRDFYVSATSQLGTDLIWCIIHF